jgi:hypothetical protein
MMKGAIRSRQVSRQTSEAAGAPTPQTAAYAMILPLALSCSPVAETATATNSDANDQNDLFFKGVNERSPDMGNLADLTLSR